VEIATFAVMSNHFHVILRNRPDVVAHWSDQEVARQWLAIFSGRVGIKPDPISTLAALAGPTAEQARSLSPGTPAMPPRGEPTDPLEQAVADAECGSGADGDDPRAFADESGELPGAAGLDGSSIASWTHGVIPPGLQSILVRLQVLAESWLETVARFGRRFHLAVGLADHLKAEAQRLGVTWLHGLRWSELAFAPPLRS